MSRLERYKQAKIVGPGVWYSGHKFCEEAVMSKEAKDFDFAYEYIKRMLNGFICGKCRAHLNSFALTNNPERFVETKDAKGLAEWWYQAHNNANQIAGNPNEEYSSVSLFFTSSVGSCNLDCDKDESKGPYLLTPIKGSFKDYFSRLNYKIKK